MSDVSHGPGWWLASDGKWYPPEAHPGATPTEIPGADPLDPGRSPTGLPSPWNSPAIPVQTPPGEYPAQQGPPGTAVPQAVAFVAPGGAIPTNPAIFHPTQSKLEKGRRVPPLVPWIVAGILLITTVVFGVIALQQSSSASQWHKADEMAIAELAAAHSSINSLNSHVSTLNTQLAAEASAKEKALDQNTVLSQLVSEEGTVSTELNTCVTDLQSLISTVGTDLGDGNYGDPTISTESNTASSDCDQAQSDNQKLQSALSGTTG